jgi:hypothetical protein
MCRRFQLDRQSNENILLSLLSYYTGSDLFSRTVSLSARTREDWKVEDWV